MTDAPKVLVVVAALLGTAATTGNHVTQGQMTTQGPSAHAILSAAQLKWGPAPAALPPGAQAAVLYGNPDKDGPFGIRLMAPANYQVPAHSHPTAEHITVLSGTFHLGLGDRLDTSRGQELKPADFASLAAGMNHYAWTTQPAVIDIHSTGPFAITYVDPKTDPRNVQAAK